MISAFGVDHGASVEKGFNPLQAFRGARAAKTGAHAAKTGTPLFDQLAAKHGIAATSSGGGSRVAAMPGKRKGSYKAKSFFGGGRGGAHRA